MSVIARLGSKTQRRLLTGLRQKVQTPTPVIAHLLYALEGWSPRCQSKNALHYGSAGRELPGRSPFICVHAPRLGPVTMLRKANFRRLLCRQQVIVGDCGWSMLGGREKPAKQVL